MNIRDKLRQLKESERRNTQRLKAWKEDLRRKQEEDHKTDRKNSKKEQGP